MTTLGKILAFVSLIIAIAMVTWSVSVYAARPTWFDPKPDGGFTPGKDQENFAQLKEEIDNLGRVAMSAGAHWGTQRTILEAAEKERGDRLKGYAERLQWARDGRDPKNPNSPGFFVPVTDSRGLIDLAVVGDPFIGPDNKPLRGANKLGANINADIAEVVRLAQECNKLRDEFKNEGVKIQSVETRLLKMGVIRESVQAELFHLASFEVNVYETRETVVRRKRQLVGRLAELGVK
jgi:hypothetical protein